MKRTRRAPEPGTPEHRRWRKNVIAGRRESRERRQRGGIYTLPELALKRGYPYAFVKRMADRGELATIGSGGRRYVQEAEAERVFGAWKGTVA